MMVGTPQQNSARSTNMEKSPTVKRASVMTHPELGKLAVRRDSYGIAHPLGPGDVEEEELPPDANPEADAGCDVRRGHLENKWGGDIRKTIKNEAKVSQKALLIETIFEQFDDDHSGTIDFEEFYLALRTCNIAISRKVAKKLLEDMDQDHSGTVDREEFVDFFRKVDNLEEFAARIEMAMERHVVRGKIMTVYIFVNMGVCFALTLMYIQSGGTNQVTFSLLLALAGMFVLAMLYAVVYPICRIKLAPAVEQVRRRVHDILHRDRRKAKDQVQVFAQGSRHLEERPRPIGGPATVSPSYRKRAHMLDHQALPALPAPPDSSMQLQLEDVDETTTQTQLALAPTASPQGQQSLGLHSQQLATLPAGASAEGGVNSQQLATLPAGAHAAALNVPTTQAANSSSPTGKSLMAYVGVRRDSTLEERLERRRAMGAAYDASRYQQARRDQEFQANRGQGYNSFNPWTAGRNGQRTGTFSPLGGVAGLSEAGQPQLDQAPRAQYIMSGDPSSPVRASHGQHVPWG